MRADVNKKQLKTGEEGNFWIRTIMKRKRENSFMSLSIGIDFYIKRAMMYQCDPYNHQQGSIAAFEL